MSNQKVLLPSQHQIVNLRDIYSEVLDELAKPFPSVKLPDWGLFNKIVGGFRMNEFSILCGPTGKGKTTLLANLSVQLAKVPCKHFVMSIETGAKDYVKRFISVLEGSDVNTGEPVPVEQLLKISEKHIKILSEGNVEFSLYESRVDIEQLKMDILYAVQILGCRIVMIDNLNYLLRVTRAQDQLFEMDNVIHDLIEFVKKVEVHLVMVMHPRKTEGGRVVSEYDIKGSSTSVQEAQNVFLFNAPTAAEINKGSALPSDRELSISKMRRRGMFVGTTLMFRNTNTQYRENGYK